MLEFVQEKIKRLKATLKEQYAQTARLEKAIMRNLRGLGYVR